MLTSADVIMRSHHRKGQVPKSHGSLWTTNQHQCHHKKKKSNLTYGATKSVYTTSISIFYLSFLLEVSLIPFPNGYDNLLCVHLSFFVFLGLCHIWFFKGKIAILVPQLSPEAHFGPSTIETSSLVPKQSNFRSISSIPIN